MQIRTGELTADNLNRLVKIDHEDETFVVGRPGEDPAQAT
jgi:hypothetical protein